MREIKTAVITGANGFIGINLVRRLLKENIHIYAFVMEEEPLKEDLFNPLVTVVRCNLEAIDYNSVDIPDNIDVMYHFAWNGVQPEDRKNFDVQFTNVNITLNCLKLVKYKKIKRIIMPGSTNEYLYSKSIINEHCIPTPRDDYGSVKVSLRFLAKQFAWDNGIEFIYAVISGIYSEQRRDSNIISYTIDKLLKKERPSVTKLEQLWDYVHIDDVVEAFFLIGQKGKSGKLYAIGHGDNWALSNYIKIISKKIDPSLPLGIGDVSYSSNDLPMSCVDLTDLKKDTGFEPKVSFEDGVTRMIANWNNFGK